MSKFYVGYKQGNEEYVYVAGIDTNNVKISTTIEGAMSFTDIGQAEYLRDIAETIVLNQEYKVLKITIDIEDMEAI